MAKSETAASTQKEWKGAFNAYSVALDRLMKNNKPALLILGVALVVSIIDVFVYGREYDDTALRLSDLIYFVFLLAMPTYALAIADDKQVTAGDVMRFSLRKYVIMLATIFLSILIFAGSFILLIIPIIWTLAWFYFATYIVVDKSLGPIEALKESKRLAAAHKGKVWGIIGVSILVSIGAGLLTQIEVVGDVALMAASIWATATTALLYRWLQKQPKQN